MGPVGWVRGYGVGGDGGLAACPHLPVVPWGERCSPVLRARVLASRRPGLNVGSAVHRPEPWSLL